MSRSGIHEQTNQGIRDGPEARPACRFMPNQDPTHLPQNNSNVLSKDTKDSTTVLELVEMMTSVRGLGGVLLYPNRDGSSPSDLAAKKKNEHRRKAETSNLGPGSAKTTNKHIQPRNHDYKLSSQSPMTHLNTNRTKPSKPTSCSIIHLSATLNKPLTSIYAHALVLDLYVLERLFFFLSCYVLRAVLSLSLSLSLSKTCVAA